MEEYEELETTLGSIIPMTPMNTIPSTPAASLNTDDPATPNSTSMPNAAILESLFAPPRRQRTTSTMDTRPSSGSFDINEHGDFDELFAGFDKHERPRSDSLVLLENLPDVSEAALLASSATVGDQKSFPSLTVTQAAQLTLQQARNGDISDLRSSSGSTSMPPPPLPSRGVFRGGRNVRFISSQTGRRVGDDEALSLTPGPCTVEERRQKIDRYLLKRSRRVWEKTIKYSVRKHFAESRPRVGGRFIPKPTGQAGYSAYQLAIMARADHRGDRRVTFQLKRKENRDATASVNEDTSSSEEEGEENNSTVNERRLPLFDYSKETLLIPKGFYLVQINKEDNAVTV